MRHKRLQPSFVEFVPEELEPGILYVSIQYGTASHLCCCGCRCKVVTPITPTDWELTFDGETVSLWPSVGNWEQACRSHYVIERSRVIPGGPWTQAQIDGSRMMSSAAKARHYGTEPRQLGPSRRATTRASGGWARFIGWLFGN